MGVSGDETGWREGDYGINTDWGQPLKGYEMMFSATPHLSGYGSR